MFRSRLLLLALLLSPLAGISPAQAHGSHGGGGEESLEAGEFNFTPIVTIEGHGGFDINLEGDPKHYAIDGMFGGVFEWGLGNGGSFAIEAAVGPARRQARGRCPPARCRRTAGGGAGVPRAAARGGDRGVAGGLSVHTAGSASLAPAGPDCARSAASMGGSRCAQGRARSIWAARFSST